VLFSSPGSKFSNGVISIDVQLVDVVMYIESSPNMMSPVFLILILTIVVPFS